jgi:stage V sporulation protein B
MFSFGIAGIMACFGYELGEAIYGSREAGYYIRVLAPLIPIMYVDSTVDAFLKGMGEQVYSMNVNIIDAGTSVLLVWLLLPRMGLWGYVVAIYVTETLNTTLSLCRMLRMSGMRVNLWRMVFGPILCALGATCILRLGGGIPGMGIHGTGGLCVALAACGGLYLLFCRVTGVWDGRFPSPPAEKAPSDASRDGSQTREPSLFHRISQQPPRTPCGKSGTKGAG